LTPVNDKGVDVTAKDLEGTFWFCLKHHAVEDFAGCGSNNRIGPFDSQSSAANAIDTIAERERRYNAEDSAWDGEK
jgi:hypothetical protein